MLDRETLTSALEIIAQSVDRSVEAVFATLRAELPGLIVSTCDDDDICDVQPLAQTPGINLYMLASSGECLSLTNDPKSMIGLVLAQVSEDND